MKASRMSRREFLRLSATTALGAAFIAACAPPAAPGEVEQPAKAPEKKRRLVFWGHDDHPIDLAATGFVKKYPEIEWVSPHPPERGAKLTAAMAAGTGCPDLFWAEATDAQDWGCRGLLTDLTEHLLPEKDNYHPLKWNETVIPTTGRNIGWPGDLSVSGWYYRADILEGLGYGDPNDWTYDDFINVASDLAKQGKYTFLFPSSGWYLARPIFAYRVHQLGGSMVSQDGQTITVADEIGIEAMRLVKQLWDSGGGLDVGWLQPPYYAAMKADQLIGQFAAAWETGFWESNLTAEEGGLGQWRVAKFPGGPNIKYRSGVFGGAQLICPKCAENKEDAVLFMKYALGSLEGAKLCGEWGIIPAYRPYLESDHFLQGKTALFGEWLHNQFWAGQEKELSTVYVRPAGWNAVLKALEEVMPAILNDEVSIEEGLQQVVELATPDFERTKCAA